MVLCGLALLALTALASAGYTTVQSSFTPLHKIRVKHFRGTDRDVCHTGADHFTGWVDLEDADSHLFYWYHEARSNKEERPLLLWLTGGPGGTGSVSLLAEHGPCRATADGRPTTEFHPSAWSEAFNMIYIDQPVNTGFSYGREVVSSSASTLQLVAFLKVFVEAFPELRGRPLHIGGESFGGRSVPLLAASILDYNSLVDDASDRIPLASILIGNGYTSPKDQLLSMYDIGCHPYKDFANFFNETECADIAQVYDRCLTLLESCEARPLDSVCSSAGQFCEEHISWEAPRLTYKYDRRIVSDTPGGYVPPRLLGSSHFLNTAEVWEAFEITAQTGRAGPDTDPVDIVNMTLFDAFVKSGDYYMSSLPDLLRVLRHGSTSPSATPVPVLYYSGNTDIACAPPGIAAFLDRLQWEGHALFRNSVWEALNWTTSSGAGAGRIRGTAGLYLAELEGAGHLAPDDQPESMLNLVNRWLDIVVERGPHKLAAGRHEVKPHKAPEADASQKVISPFFPDGPLSNELY